MENTTPDAFFINFHIFEDRYLWYLFFETMFTCVYRYHFRYFQHLVFYWILPIFLYICVYVCVHVKFGIVIFLLIQQIFIVHLLCARNFLSLWVKVNKTTTVPAFAETAVILTCNHPVCEEDKQGTVLENNRWDASGRTSGRPQRK